MAYQGNVTLRKRLLGVRLKGLREGMRGGQGMTADAAAQKVGCSKSKILRQENGFTSVSADDLTKLIALYEVEEPAVIALLETYRAQGRKRGTWHSYGPNIGPTLRDLADAETIAKSMRMWEVGVVPGILQTEEYTRATILGDDSPTIGIPGPEAAKDKISLREERKAVLDKEHPPTVWAVIGEGALRTENGSRKVLKNQIEHLIELSSRPNITIQVLPFSAGANTGASGSFLLLGFEEHAADQAVYFEVSNALTDDLDLVALNRHRMDILQSQAMSIPDSLRFMAEISATL